MYDFCGAEIALCGVAIDVEISEILGDESVEYLLIPRIAAHSGMTRL
ncbi:MAG: hypothetical protein AB1861_27835 [Cyanobacteriota bacterium]